MRYLQYLINILSYFQKEMLKTTIALTNNIVGSTVLVLPILFLSNGIFLSILLVFINGFYNYYSCKITIEHLGVN
jgi:amino acid permease